MTEAARPTILRVAVDAPLAEALDYLPATTDGPVPVPGQRLLVPFRRSQRVGVVLEQSDHSPLAPERLRRVLRVLDPEPLLSAQDLALIRWAAAYYHHPLGEVLFTALPARLRRPEPLLDDGVAGVRATPAGLAISPAALARAPRQQAVLELLQAAPEGVALSVIRSRCDASAGVLQALQTKGLVTHCQLPSAIATGADIAPLDCGPEPNADQAAAISSLRAALGGFRPFLLEGVTGSGKTEVYIRLIATLLAAGGQALVLVPEIGLTPQLRERLRRRLPGPIAVLHSDLGSRERERNWQLAARGEASLVLGTRSAIFTPLPRLRLILVDEEHDASLKQQEGLRYSARDLAVRRAQLAGCPVVLGSATPSLETLHNAQRGRYQWLRLPKRAGPAQPPSIALLDIRNQPLQAGLSPVLREQMHQEIAAGSQVLLFLNRRGYAPVCTCHACGWVGGCPHCDARLTLHLAERRLWCHHCGFSQPMPQRCSDCGSHDLRLLGRGTERLEEELQPLFPQARIARIDRDSIRRKGELERRFAQVASGEVQILLGTQMLAKGHDFPRVTLVGILDLDQSLYASDFRAPERTAQLIIQVAGRAGRAERPGRVVLQTRHPEHPLLQSLLNAGLSGFAAAAMAERQAAELPPFAHLALLRADAPQPGAALGFLGEARRLAEHLRAEQLQRPAVALLGPVPAPMERRAGRHRAQLLVQCAARAPLHAFLDTWLAALRAVAPPKGLRWSVDVDPQDML